VTNHRADRLAPLPAEFVRNTLGSFGVAGERWLAELPAALAAYARRWDLTLGPAYQLTYHYVAAAIRADGTPAVLKLGVPGGVEFGWQVRALRLVDGDGMARLLAADVPGGAMLLERVEPGHRLTPADESADPAATEVLLDLMRRLHRPVPPPAGSPPTGPPPAQPPTAQPPPAQPPNTAAPDTAHRTDAGPPDTGPPDNGPPDNGPAGTGLPTVADWGRGFSRLRARHGGGTGPLPGALVDRAERLYAELAGSPAGPPVLLHGDLHHENALRSDRAGWLAIDPKGLLGEPAYEVGPVLLNPWDELLTWPDPAGVLTRRVHQLADGLAVPRDRVRAWGFAFAVLSAIWTDEAGGDPDQHSLAVAELLTGR
jgi:streptomycin 6-kinase